MARLIAVTVHHFSYIPGARNVSLWQYCAQLHRIVVLLPRTSAKRSPLETFHSKTKRVGE